MKRAELEKKGVLLYERIVKDDLYEVYGGDRYYYYYNNAIYVSNVYTNQLVYMGPSNTYRIISNVSDTIKKGKLLEELEDHITCTEDEIKDIYNKIIVEHCKQRYNFDVNIMIKCIRKINYAAKYYGRLKQQSYDDGDHTATRQYKLLQKRLYLAKSLAICFLLDNGAINKKETVKDGKSGSVLIEIECPTTGNMMHQIASNQDADGDLKTFNKWYSKKYDDSMYKPYLYYIIHHMPKKYKNLFNELDFTYNYYLSNGMMRKFSHLLNTLVDSFADYDYTIYTDSMVVTVNVHHNGIMLYDFKISRDPMYMMYDFVDPYVDWYSYGLWPSLSAGKRFFGYDGDIYDEDIVYSWEQSEYTTRDNSEVIGHEEWYKFEKLPIEQLFCMPGVVRFDCW